MRDLKKMVRRITAVFLAGVIAAGIVCTPALAATRPSSQEETEEFAVDPARGHHLDISF